LIASVPAEAESVWGNAGQRRLPPGDCMGYRWHDGDNIRDFFKKASADKSKLPVNFYSYVK